ncbi:CCAAT/enhancer-binding protein zeta-like isoform X2 [Oncorhynchus nerka]|uniref:CCAAT/enhancer-binding protein zeta-like isoform X2 n=1 Tax=Oncorhynchus nerka TaxID=8023 RepID=UPI0011305646|nr:CCAAT/enhancer-binding protein zeta-like isoform X1 [Oncorhynchus nerka]XP_029508026.1 CCAAT/enhancer-binding protein zeta-like isoform X1 [Oncorhynchus nerka]
MDSIGEDDEEVPELDDNTDSDEMEVPHTRPGSKKRKASEDLDFSGCLGSKPGKKRKGKEETAMLASAEEFVYMLDENAGSKFDNIGMNAMSNKDKAGVRQLKWEAQRDDWVRGRDIKTLLKKKAMFNKKKQFGKPRAGKKTIKKN